MKTNNTSEHIISSKPAIPLENPNIFVKCLRRSHTVAIDNDFPVFCSPTVFKAQNHPSF